MTTNLILLTIAALIFYGYTYGYVYRTVGMLKSISDSVYFVKNTLWFQLTMMLFPIPFIIAGENVATTWLQQFTCFFGGALICFVGVAACIKKGNKSEETIHVIGATGGILLGTIYVSTFGKLFEIIAILFLLFTIYAMYAGTRYSKEDWGKINYFKRVMSNLPIVHNHTWVIEVVAVTMILGTVLIQTLIKL